MKKIFIACDNSFFKYALYVKEDLELMGYEVILPNFSNSDDKFRTNEEHIKFFKDLSIESQLKAKECDAILVLNLTKIVDNKIELNYIDNFNFLRMYNFYLEDKKIFLFTGLSINHLYNQVKGINPKSLGVNLFNLEDNYIKFENNNLINYFSKKELENIEKIEDLYSKAFIITAKVFKDKKDKSGKPYFNHLFRVSMKLDEEIEQVAALLHDIVEDTEITFKDLLEIGFSTEILQIVKLVTKPNIDTSNMTKKEKLKLYSNEIDSIISSENMHAIRLKQADMSDNYDKERLKELPQEQQEWFEEKYGKQLIKLRKVTEKEKIL